MSFFTGSDVNSKRILHMTSTRDSLTTMKSGIINSTIYHSRMQLIEFDNYILHSSGTRLNRTVTYSKFTGTGLTSYLNDKTNKAVMCLDMGFNYINYYIWGDILHVEGVVSSIIILVLKEKTTLGQLVSRNIQMLGDGIYSGTTNLTRMKYIVNNSINTYDPIITFPSGRQFQLVNYYYKNAGLEIFMRGASPYVKLGGHVVLGGGKIPTQTSYVKVNKYAESVGSSAPHPTFIFNYEITPCDFFMIEIAVTRYVDPYKDITYSTPKIYRSELIPYGSTTGINPASMFDVYIGNDAVSGKYGVIGMFWTIYTYVGFNVRYYYDIEIRKFG